jgi:hypothetical protein
MTKGVSRSSSADGLISADGRLELRDANKLFVLVSDRSEEAMRKNTQR